MDIFPYRTYFLRVVLVLISLVSLSNFYPIFYVGRSFVIPFRDGPVFELAEVKVEVKVIPFRDGSVFELAEVDQLLHFILSTVTLPGNDFYPTRPRRLFRRIGCFKKPHLGQSQPLFETHQATFEKVTKKRHTPAAHIPPLHSPFRSIAPLHSPFLRPSNRVRY